MIPVFEKYKKIGQKIAAMLHLSKFPSLSSLQLNFTSHLHLFGSQVQEKDQNIIGGGEATSPREQGKRLLSPFADFNKILATF